MASPTERTLIRLRAEGWVPDICERRLTPIIKKDLFGLLDIIALRGKEILGVQCTTLSHVGERIKKFAASENTSKLRDAGFRLEVWGWRKLGGRWEPKIVDLS